MKTKSLLTILFVCLAFISCKKTSEKNETVSAKKHLVKFNVSKLLVSTESMASASGKKLAAVSGADLTKNISHLHLVVIDWGSYEYVASVHQIEGDPNFGNLEIQLPDGEYSVGIIGSREPKSVDSRRGFLFFGGVGGDVFVKGFDLNVNGEDINETAELVRIVGKFKLNFPKVPANADKVLLYPRGMETGSESLIWPDIIHYGRSPYTMAYWGTNGYSAEYTFTDEDKKKPDFSLNLYVPTNNMIFYRDLVLQIIDKNGQTTFANTLLNVPIERNKVLTIKGDPFKGGPSAMAVKLDGTWLSDTTKVNF